MIACPDADPYVEAAAIGETLPDEVRAHVETCALCAARLRLAARIDQILATRPVQAPPAAFAATVLGVVRQQRWRTEQMIDWSFNAVLGAGLVFIVAGLGSLMYASGLVAVGREVFAAFDAAGAATLDSLAGHARTFLMAAALLTLTLGVWWWAEQDATV